MKITDDWTIDWRDKGFPPSPAGVAASRIAEQRWQVGEHFMTPIATLAHSALVHNAARMQSYCDEHGVRIAPHGKTTMSPELVNLQLEHGAWGITAATAWQARALAAFGVRRILIANECVDPVGLRMLADLFTSHPDVEVAAFVDSIAAVEVMAETLHGLAPRPFSVLVEVGAAGHRAGARDVSTAVEVGRAVAQASELGLVGVGCFEGVLGADRTPEVLTSVQELLETTRQVAQVLLDDDAFRPDHPVILTAGGSAFFDQVVAALTARPGSWTRDLEVVIRSGCYLTHDHGTYRASSPFAGSGELEFRPALHVWSRVISTPEPGLAIIDAGKRDVSSDGRLPVVVGRSRDGAYVAAPSCGLDTLVVDRLNDQHGYLVVPPPTGELLRVGDLVVLGVSHPCTTFDKWRAIPVLDDEFRAMSAVRTYF